MAQESTDATQLDQLVAFAAVAAHSSFTRAAKELGRDVTGVSRRVAHLETRLGVRLLERTTRKVTLTEAGATLLARVEPSLRALREAEHETAALGDTVRGTLRLTVAAWFGRKWLMPMLPDFLSKHPDVCVIAETSNRYMNLVDDGFDAAIRITKLNDSSLVARKLAENRRVICAAPAYLKRHGEPLEPRDLEQHACLGFSGYASHPNWPVVRRDGKARTVVRISGPLVLDDAEGLVPAALAGLGIMVGSAWTINDELRRGTLVPILTDWTIENEGAIYVVVPSRSYLPAKTRAFLDWITAKFAAGAPWEVHAS